VPELSTSKVARQEGQKGHGIMNDDDDELVVCKMIGGVVLLSRF
jgi:hypothetical protein